MFLLENAETGMTGHKYGMDKLVLLATQKMKEVEADKRFEALDAKLQAWVVGDENVMPLEA